MLHFTKEIANKLLREGAQDDLQFGLLALSMEDQTVEDFRITLTLLALIWHAAEKLGIDPTEPIHAVSELSSRDTARVFEGFLERNDESKAISQFGHRETEGHNFEWEYCRQLSPAAQRSRLLGDLKSDGAVD